MEDLLDFVVQQKLSSSIENDWEDFQEMIKISPSTIQKFGLRVFSIRNSTILNSTLTKSYKSYSNLPQIKLPKTNLKRQSSLEEIIKSRRSIRSYSNEICTLQELSNILQLSYGINGVLKYSSNDVEITQYLRTIPSAGALYPLEIYICIFKLHGITPGVYHYRVAQHALEQLQKGNKINSFMKLGVWTDIEVTRASFIIIISSVTERVTFKYGNRGFRFSILEVGFASMVMDLLARTMNIGVCHLGGFYDDLVNSFLGINGVSESVQTVLCFGKTNNNKIRNKNILPEI